VRDRVGENGVGCDGSARCRLWRIRMAPDFRFCSLSRPTLGTGAWSRRRHPTGHPQDSTLRDRFQAAARMVAALIGRGSGGGSSGSDGSGGSALGGGGSCSSGSEGGDSSQERLGRWCLGRRHLTRAARAARAARALGLLQLERPGSLGSGVSGGGSAGTGTGGDASAAAHGVDEGDSGGGGSVGGGGGRDDGKASQRAGEWAGVASGEAHRGGAAFAVVLITAVA